MSRYSGMLAASGAYIIWGVLPIYWKALKAVPPLEILCHRMSWSLIFTMALILVSRRFTAFRRVAANRGNLRIFGTTALLLAVNWLIYIWAVNAGFIVEASLGYFINPLISVLMGVVFFKERLRLGQCAALLLVVAGVGYLTVFYGRFPWIALSLASSFAVYGLLHKKSSVSSMDALGLEILIFFVPAAAYLFLYRRYGRRLFSGRWTDHLPASDRHRRDHLLPPAAVRLCRPQDSPVDPRAAPVYRPDHQLLYRHLPLP